MPDDKRYDTISVRAEHEIRASVEKLVNLIQKETGMRVSTGDAVNVAVIEAIKNREDKS